VTRIAAAVGLVSDVLASAATEAHPFRLLDVGTGTGRYLDMVSARLSATLVTDLCSIGLDRSPAMLGQARRLNKCAYPGASHPVGAVETLPIRAASCDAMTCFNAVHHFGSPKVHVGHFASLTLGGGSSMLVPQSTISPMSADAE